MKNTNTVKLGLMYLVLGAMFIFTNPTLFAQGIFSEDFGGGMPASFKLVDVDGQTPNNADLFTTAWIAFPDIDDTTNLAAASTSWYIPAGIADDWMMTPMISIPDTGASLVFKWQGKAYQGDFPDGYEVRVSSDTARTIDSYSTVLFSTPAENASWITRTVNVDSYKGQTVSFAFRNNSSDQNILYIDNISVEAQAAFDLAITNITDPTPGYSLVPLPQAGPFTLEVEITNQGSGTLDSVIVEAIVLDGTGNNLLFLDDMGGVVPSLGAGESMTLSGAGSFTPPDTGTYFVAYLADAMQVDSDTTNNFDFSSAFISDSTYARDIPPITNIFGLGTSGTLGQTFQINQIDTVSSVLAVFVDPPVGQETRVVINLLGGDTPLDQPLYESNPYTFTTEDNPNPDETGQPNDIALINFTFPDSIVTLLVPGSFYFGIVEDGENIRLGATQDIYTEGSIFLYVEGQNSWFTGQEAYGPTFGNSFIIRPSFASAKICNLNVEVATTQDDGSGNGTAVATISGGTEPYSINWSSGQTTPVAVNLTGGMYTLTVEDALGCSVTETVNIITVGIEDDIAAGLNRFDVYPNPNNGQFKIDIELAERDDLEISLLDVQGRTVYTTTLKSTLIYEKSINVGRLATGLYTLKVNTSKGSTFKRILID